MWIMPGSSSDPHPPVVLHFPAILAIFNLPNIHAMLCSRHLKVTKTVTQGFQDRIAPIFAVMLFVSTNQYEFLSLAHFHALPRSGSCSAFHLISSRHWIGASSQLPRNASKATSYFEHGNRNMFIRNMFYTFKCILKKHIVS